MQHKDYYSILGINKDANQEDIKKTFRMLAKKYHPDANPADKKAEEKFKDINEAYEVLSDPEKKQKYDDLLESDYNFNQYQENYSPGYSDFFHMFFDSTSFDLWDILSGKISKRSSFNFASRGRNIEASIEISPIEGLKGVKKRISIKGPTGEKSITFNIPKGIRAGEKIRLAGQGEPGVNGGGNGDLYLSVKFKECSNFRIEGNDIYTTLDLFPWDAALGVDASVITISGKLKVKIPSGVQTGTEIRIAHKGYIDRSNTRGDLYIIIRIVNPDIISPPIKRLYESLQDLSSKA